MQRLRLIAVAVIAATLLALAGVTGSTSPAGANPNYTGLAPATYSPRYSSNGCLYRIVYVLYGSFPVADVRLYGSGCTNVSVAVAGQNGSTITWTWNHSNPAPYGVDSCGAYSLLQAIGPGPALGVGASIIAANDWHIFRYDGTSPPPTVVPC